MSGSRGRGLTWRTSRPMQLIEDKKALGDKCGAVVAELKQGEQRRQEREAQMREQHALVSGRGARLQTTPPSPCPASKPVTGWCRDLVLGSQERAVPAPTARTRAPAVRAGACPRLRQLLPTPVFSPVGDQEAQRADERDGEGAQGEVDEREDPEDQGDHGQRWAAAERTRGQFTAGGGGAGSGGAGPRGPVGARLGSGLLPPVPWLLPLESGSQCTLSPGLPPPGSRGTARAPHWPE